ncbi:DNA-3-methyladenine glycosylase I [Ectothiorhodosinus mongolicus]|uniref:DNA-3-methyladenine glycosylase I n=1 Tax=Ectothiorhodosinus mongolicus TaxID=233100 RepID=A0A1R3VQ77_9GAMM|nr:DNA-3-methyladenine glycosylase I [Ectothiorhodosinus mongolicus]ULX57839.1 DNA-3-methyladenine glycosylase I [Ectothiorhodosinus mongolicus]SIT65713.1 DNA-3-methyladenine glycosylase I [Ectothiorhodosinus mongolicus]
MANDIKRCAWCAQVPELIHYHDTEWGFPVYDDQHLFEKICLEIFQCGLSWRTVLEKRSRLRLVFHGFEHERMARMTDDDVERLMQDAGIIRHRGKIRAVIHNAARVPRLLEEEGSLASFIWRFAPDDSVAHVPQSVTTSPESLALAKALKSRGWKFVGPTNMYAFMQSMGLINDHETDCAIRDQVFQARAALNS